MNGVVRFSELSDMAEFLRLFAGSTAVFVAGKDGQGWYVEFTGGY
jgi:hypothetical protein